MGSTNVAFNLSFTFVSETCWVAGCGVAFALERDFMRKVVDHGTTFYCPNGHRIRYGESEVEQLRRELTAERDSHKWTEARLKREKRCHRATRGVVTKIKKRVGNGVCPCCNRSFTNLKRHMATKHADYKHATAHAASEED